MPCVLAAGCPSLLMLHFATRHGQLPALQIRGRQRADSFASLSVLMCQPLPSCTLTVTTFCGGHRPPAPAKHIKQHIKKPMPFLPPALKRGSEATCSPARACSWSCSSRSVRS